MPWGVRVVRDGHPLGRPRWRRADLVPGVGLPVRRAPRPDGRRGVWW